MKLQEWKPKQRLKHAFLKYFQMTSLINLINISSVLYCLIILPQSTIEKPQNIIYHYKYEYAQEPINLVIDLQSDKYNHSPQYLQIEFYCIMYDESTYDQASYIQITDLYEDIGYFIIRPFSCEQPKWSNSRTTVSYVVTYTDNNTKMKIIMEEYKNMNPLTENKRLQFTLSSGYLIDEDLSIRDLKVKMGDGNINGLNLFIKQLLNKKLQYEDDDYYEDDILLSIYLSHLPGFGSRQLSLYAEIPLQNRISEVFTISVDGESSLFAIIDAILYQMKKECGVNITRDDISQVVNKETQKPVQNKKTLIDQSLYNRSKLQVQLKNPSMQLRRINTKDYNSYIIIYKEEGKDPKKFKYSEIAQLTFSQLYTIHLEFQNSKHRRDVCYGLKINCMIIKPNDKINQAEKYFKNESNDPLYVLARVVGQKIVFFDKIPSLIHKVTGFVLDDYIEIPKNQKAKRKRVRQQSKSRALLTNKQYFKQHQRVEPIMIYTSDLRYFESQQKKQQLGFLL